MLTTSTPTATVQRHAQAYHDHADRQAGACVDAEERIGEMTYRTLLDTRDEASELGEWRVKDMLDSEVQEREASAVGTLSRLFHEAITSNGTIPWVCDGKLGTALIAVAVQDGLDNLACLEDATRMVMDAGYRAKLIGQLAADYALERHVELLRAGWGE